MQELVMSERTPPPQKCHGEAKPTGKLEPDGLTAGDPDVHICCNPLPPLGNDWAAVCH